MGALADWWQDVCWWWRYGPPREPSPEALNELIEALRPKAGAWPWEDFKPCPLHPKNISTPTLAKCCFNPRLEIESLQPVMQNVTFTSNGIKVLSYTSHR